ncbi:MAG: exonuclease SbcCD subunit D [Bacteroidales bacterium]|nr:exonuclease SbcCD subunit D [Bacteroidales bacterium]
MLKVLHTSDWHLGHRLYEHDRGEEQQDCMSQIVKIVREQQPDAVVICGDVFDVSAPPQSARKMYIDTLKKMQEALPGRPIVVTAGNHDGKMLLENDGALLHPNDIVVIGEINKKDNGAIDYDHHIIAVRDAKGVLKGFIVAMPHVYEQSYPIADNAARTDSRMQIFHEALMERVAEVNENNLPVVLTEHLYLIGSDTSGHEYSNYGDREIVGSCESVPQSRLGSGYDYLALGHIHRAQNVTNSKPLARYCGTPIDVSFDETGDHGVTLVSIMEHGAEPQVEHIPIANYRPLETVPNIPKTFAEVMADAIAYPDDKKSYIRLNVLDDAPLPADYMNVINKTFENKQARFCTIKHTAVSAADSNGEDSAPRYFSPEEMPSPMEIATMHYQRKYGHPMPDDLADLLIQIVEEVEREKYDEK